MNDPARSGGRSAPAARRLRAVESMGSVSDALGIVDFGSAIFAVTRGQWSMIDAILHVLDCCTGDCHLSIWTWTVAEYEVEVLTRLRLDSRLSTGRLIIDHGARNRNKGVIAEWQGSFGPHSVRYVVNHAKIATVRDAAGRRFLLRGSMNLNFNPRFEQFDLTEGGEDFEMVAAIEEGLPVLADDCSGDEASAASQVGRAFKAGELAMFQGVKTWAK
jgi:hypothetical protein